MVRGLSVVCIALALCGVTFSALAEDGLFKPSVINQEPYQTYIISAVLKKTGSEGVVRLVHKVQKGRSEDEATGAFLKEVLHEFKGYTVADSIVGFVPSERASCETWL